MVPQRPKLRIMSFLIFYWDGSASMLAVLATIFMSALNVLQISSNILRIPIYLFTNKISKKIECFGGMPPFRALKKWSLPKMTPHDYLWPPFFLAESYSAIKMGVFAKKLDLNILKIDWVIVILSLKKKFEIFCFKFWEILLLEENCYNSANF